MYGLMPWSVATVDDETLQAYVDQTGVSFPVMFDDDQTYRRYDAVGATAPFPLDVVIDKNGVVRYLDTRYAPDEMEALVKELLAE